MAQKRKRARHSARQGSQQGPLRGPDSPPAQAASARAATADASVPASRPAPKAPEPRGAAPREGSRRAPPRVARRPPRRAWWQGPGAVVGMVAVVGAAVAVFVIQSRTNTPPPPAPAPSAAAKIIGEIASVSPATLDAVGSGGATNTLKSGGRGPVLTGPGGKPAVLYMGAEFCPYCAAERWSLVVALTRFGTFTGVDLNRSTANDVYPDTPTFTFRHAKFSSPYLDFMMVELEDRNQNLLQTPTAQERSLMSKYDASGNIPFVDIGNRQVATGGWIPDMLGPMTWQQIADDLSNPDAASTKAIVGHANYLTAAICQITGQKPASACSSPAIQRLQSGLAR